MTEWARPVRGCCYALPVQNRLSRETAKGPSLAGVRLGRGEQRVFLMIEVPCVTVEATYHGALVPTCRTEPGTVRP